ncbi:hypothetical protein ACHIPZ_25160, partial [Antrihabitans sp. NCIMB 15449]
DGLLKDHAVTSRYPVTTRSDFAGVRSYTILLDSTLRNIAAPRRCEEVQILGWPIRKPLSHQRATACEQKPVTGRKREKQSCNISLKFGQH